MLSEREGEREPVCIVLPQPDWHDPSAWMKQYNFRWHQLGCDKTQ